LFAEFVSLLQRKIEEDNEDSSESHDLDAAKDLDTDDSADEQVVKKRAAKKKKDAVKAKKIELENEGKQLFEDIISRAKPNSKMAESSLDLPATKRDTIPHEIPANVPLSEDIIKSIVRQALQEQSQTSTKREKKKSGVRATLSITEADCKEWMTRQAKIRNLWFQKREDVPLSEFLDDYIQSREDRRMPPLSEAQKAEVTGFCQIL